MSVTLRQLDRHIHHKPPKTISLRQLLKLNRANVHLKARKSPFSILTYNMALLPDILADYLGTNRENAILELCERIEADPPDVVGLCEVFKDGERQLIREKLDNIYQFFCEGPDTTGIDPDQDGGLLLLSSNPILALHPSMYGQNAGNDMWANKGILHIRIKPTDSPTPYDIFYTHTQDIEPDGGKEALYSQLLHLAHMSQAYGDPHHPTLIMGDLNIPGEIPQHYEQLIQRLLNPVDLWLVHGQALSDGFTNTKNNNFYEDPDDAPPRDSRLDYILMQAGLHFIPILTDIELLKWSHDGRQISDHYGLLAKFEQLVEVGINISGTISATRACIKAFRCIQETDQIGSDEVSFFLSVRNSQGNFALNTTDKFEDVKTGQTRNVAMKFAQLDGDPGDSITVTVGGSESDELSDSEELGKRSISISRTDLLLNQGSSFLRYMPFLTKEGGEYSLVVEISVN